jgi:hypothetical protein
MADGRRVLRRGNTPTFRNFFELFLSAAFVQTSREIMDEFGIAERFIFGNGERFCL